MASTEIKNPITEDVINRAQQHVTDYFTKHITDAYSYHNLEHTLEVSQLAYELGTAEKVEIQDLFKLKLAGLFHDIGYKEGAQGHEARSAQLAETWMHKQNLAQKDITDVKRLINVTKMGVEPADHLEQIISDADVAHVGTKKFSKRTKALRSEKVLVEGTSYTDEEWIKNNIYFLGNLKYHTESAREKFSARKEKNIAKLEKILALRQEPKTVIDDKKLYKSIDGNKGVQTMFRTTLRNHNQLSKIADNKASIMLSISAIMLSIVVSTLAPKLDNNPHLMLPAVMVITVCMLTIIFSILSARPKISNNKFSTEKFNANKFNILFFGNFASMKLDEFEWAMKELMKEPDKLYSSMSQDLYFLGVVLVKKYKLLNLAYTIFMIGMLISAAAFIFVFITYDASLPADTPYLLNNQ